MCTKTALGSFKGALGSFSWDSSTVMYAHSLSTHTHSAHTHMGNMSTKLPAGVWTLRFKSQGSLIITPTEWRTALRRWTGYYHWLTKQGAETLQRWLTLPIPAGNLTTGIAFEPALGEDIVNPYRSEAQNVITRQIRSQFTYTKETL